MMMTNRDLVLPTQEEMTQRALSDFHYLIGFQDIFKIAGNEETHRGVMADRPRFVIPFLKTYELTC